MNVKRFFLIFQLLVYPLFANDLLEDLLLVEKIDQYVQDALPLYSNHFLQAGCFQMPTARSFKAGDLAFGFSKMHPYTVLSLRAQPFDCLEITTNYRIFDGICDPVLSPYGFGDFSDKGVNLKILLLRPEESRTRSIGLAIGLDDFLGTRSFHGWYGVATYCLPIRDLEISLGYGKKRYKGLFGSLLWSPYRQCSYPYLQPLTLALEYDATDYRNPKREPHPKARKIATRWNAGLKYRLGENIDLSLATLRGKELSFSVQVHTSLADTKGFLPKCKDPLPYQGAESDDLPELFAQQGFFLREIALDEHNNMRLKIENERYYLESVLRYRLYQILSKAFSQDLYSIRVEVESEGIVVREYFFLMSDLQRYKSGEIGGYELSVLTPALDLSPDWGENQQRTLPYFVSYRPFWQTLIKPKIHNHFGSARGKYKGALGIQVGGEGFVWNKLYFQILFGTLLYSGLEGLAGIDRLNPSQLNNVHSDHVRYYKKWGITLDTAYVQHGWNLGKGCYIRTAAGCFERPYGGLTCEMLYYPANSRYAIGIEASKLYRRTLKGWGFVNKIRKLNGFTPYFRKFHGSQYFLDFYYDLLECRVDCKVSVGKFLADDWGARTEVSRYFSNGVRMGAWYTYTGGKDRINRERYHDRGVFLSMPLDFFYCQSSRERWEYSLAPWLRDVGYRANTGYGLFESVRMY